MWTYNYTDELYHYGVKGMKWGHRRALRKEIRSARDKFRENEKARLSKEYDVKGRKKSGL